MPKRTDIKKILLIGSGPIVIGQACEFDYSGTQACKALREEGYQVILLNSNPATIMTDPSMADRTYIEPIVPEVLEKIIERERPDAILATLGGQTALNVAVKVAEAGILDKFGVEMIGADCAAIKRAEDRATFKTTMQGIGLDLPRSGVAHSMAEARNIVKQIGLPAIVRPSFTLGGTGGAIAYNIEEFEHAAAFGLDQSMINETLIEESVIGWKEYELEVMRDKADNVVIICSIENMDPMGIHTGDSITVAPAQTLTDKEYQRMRNASIAVIRAIGVETGGSNIQFAVHPGTGRMVIIEMNPRVSRSSALASKATGFAIAKIAAKLAVGYTLDELPNDITQKTPASFEPTIDYCVVKLPRFAFEKFPGTDNTLTISMKSVGETMAIGRTFKEALQKGLRGLEIGVSGLDLYGEQKLDLSKISEMLIRPTAHRIFYVKAAIKQDMPVEKISRLTGIDPWFIENIRDLVKMEKEIGTAHQLQAPLLRKAKRQGFSDRQIAEIIGSDELKVRKKRIELGVHPVYKLVDTCAAEFEAYTPYYYSTYETEDEDRPSTKRKALIIGGGPNRIGQGIEFDYCCVHASLALREIGIETIMVNSNPETVSTDYDISDKLYFEPLTLEDLLNIIEREKPEGVIVQLGGQTPLNLALPLAREGVKIMGTQPDAINRAEDRKLFRKLLDNLKLRQAPSDTATSIKEAEKIAGKIGYPVLLRPSYVLGGRGMMIVWDSRDLERFAADAIEVSSGHPILIDKFLEEAIEIDVDAVADGERVIIGGVMEHIEEAGIHSGDSAMVLPAHTIGQHVLSEIKEATRRLALELGVRGLMNVQYAVKGKTVYVLEVNPRASRTIPFVSKAVNVPLANIATKIMAGFSLDDLGLTKDPSPNCVSVKESVLPFTRFPGTDTILGPEMRSTGEVMGIDTTFPVAYWKSQLAAGQGLPDSGNVFISVRDMDKPGIVPIARKFLELGFNILTTEGTHDTLTSHGIACQTVSKVAEGRPNIIDYIKNNDVALIINTPSGPNPRKDEVTIRRAALNYNVPLITTLAGATASADAIKAIRNRGFSICSLQEINTGSLA